MGITVISCLQSRPFWMFFFMKMGWFDLAYSTAWSGGECFFWHLEIILLFSRWCNRFSQLWQLSKHNIRVNGIPGDDGKIDIRWSLAFRCVTLAEKNSILLTLSLGKNVCTTQSRALYCTVLLYVTQMAAELRPILPWSLLHLHHPDITQALASVLDVEASHFGSHHQSLQKGRDCSSDGVPAEHRMMYDSLCKRSWGHCFIYIMIHIPWNRPSSAIQLQDIEI